MSKIKNPREKKIASLLHDRRNVYGENDKSSRKNIPRSKQISHQAIRSAANRPLSALVAQTDEDAFTEAESIVRENIMAKERKGFSKSPDAPLGQFLESKQTGNWLKTNRAYWLENRRPKNLQ